MYTAAPGTQSTAKLNNVLFMRGESSRNVDKYAFGKNLYCTTSKNGWGQLVLQANETKSKMK